jgi:hypothetical protein
MAKSETSTKFKIRNWKLQVTLFGALDFGHSDLFRVSYFGFSSVRHGTT